MSKSYATPDLWKQPFSAVRASGGYPGNAVLHLFSSLGASPEVWTLPDAVRQRPYFWRTRHPPNNSVGSLALVLSWLHSRRIPWEAVGTGHPTDRLVQTGNRADEFYTPRVLPSYFSLEIRKHVAIYATSGHLWCSIFEAALNVSALLFYLAFISLKARRIK